MDTMTAFHPNWWELIGCLAIVIAVAFALTMVGRREAPYECITCDEDDPLSAQWTRDQVRAEARVGIDQSTIDWDAMKRAAKR